MALQSRGCGECRPPRGGAFDLDSRRLSRSVACPQRSSGHECLDRWASQNTAGVGASLERSVDLRTSQANATALLESGYRLAPVAVLGRAAAEPQRVVLRQAAARDQEVSRLRLGLHCQLRPSLHAGADLGSSARIDGHSVATAAGENSRNGPENQVSSAGSRVLQYPRRGVSAARSLAVPDARHVSREEVQETPPAHRFVADQTTAGRMVPTHHEESAAATRGEGVARIPPTPQPQRRQAGQTETLVCRMARAGLADRDSRPLSATIWHRNELSADAPSPNLHVYARSPSATVVRGGGFDPEEYLGLDSPHAAGGRGPRSSDVASGAIAIQTHVGLGRS